MIIIDERKSSPAKPAFEDGDILIGFNSGDPYLVYHNGTKALNLASHSSITTLGIDYSEIIKKDNITITFKGEK